MFRSLAVLAACFSLSIAALAQQGSDRPLVINRVAINQTHIAFTYAGKIWLVERTGGTVRVVESTPANFKVTTPHDLELAAYLLADRLPRPSAH